MLMEAYKIAFLNEIKSIPQDGWFFLKSGLNSTPIDYNKMFEYIERRIHLAKIRMSINSTGVYIFVDYDEFRR